jgi:hypothetical protein
LSGLLANDFHVLYESRDPATIYAYTPGICRLDDGRLIATIDQGGPGVEGLDGPKGTRGEGKTAWQGIVWTSDDHGESWVERARYPFMHARPFVAGSRVYVMGHDSDLTIIASEDNGETWSDPVALTSEQYWHQSACNVLYANNAVYLVMERRTRFNCPGWYVSEIAPVLMKGSVDTDLTRVENWTFASELSFYELEASYGSIPVPFFNPGETAPGRSMAPPGWLESNVVQFQDPNHIWHDPDGRTFHMWMRAHTGGTGLACVAKVVESADGQMTTMLEDTPAGDPFLYVPCPGGQMRYHILYDEPTKLYWLLGSVATDSTCRPDCMPPNRYNLPNNERHVQGLHYSANCIDWVPAGIVAKGDSPGEARHYASMVIDGDDLHVLSRSGDRRAKTAHDGNLITFHTVQDFRDLVLT